MIVIVNLSGNKEKTCEKKKSAIYWFQLFFTDKYVNSLSKLSKSYGSCHLGQIMVNKLKKTTNKQTKEKKNQKQGRSLLIFLGQESNQHSLFQFY